MRKLKETLRESTKDLRIDALPNIFKASHGAGSLFWLLILLASCASCAYMIASALEQFYAYKPTTSIRHLNEPLATLPTVTLCNVNPFTTVFAIGLLRLSRATQLNTTTESPSAYYWLQYLHIEDYLNQTRGYTLTHDEKLALGATELVVSFPGDKSEWPALDYIFHPRFFGCVRYNVRGDMSVTQVGTFFDALLYTGGVDPRIGQLSVGHLQGFYVFIQNASDYALDMDRSPLVVSPGGVVDVTIRRRFHEQQPAPYSECGHDLADRTHYDAVVASMRPAAYTRQTCLSFCAQALTARQCGCMSKRVAFRVANASECGKSDELACAASVWTWVDAIARQCMPLCPLECARSYFDVDVNYFKQYDLFYAYYNLTLDVGNTNLYGAFWISFLRSNSLTLRLNYESLSYIESREEPAMSSDDLLATIGGYLHLFVGMSLLCLAELGEMLLAVVCAGRCCFSTRTRKNDDGDDGVWRESLDQMTRLKIDALPNLVRSAHKAVAAFWLLMLLSALATCSYFVANTLEQYNQFQVITAVQPSSRAADESSSSPVLLPAITFCSFNPFTTDYAFKTMTNLTSVYLLQGVSFIPSDAKSIYTQNDASRQKRAIFVLEEVKSFQII